MKIVKTALIQLGLLAALSCSSGILLAQPAEAQHGPSKPPQEALDACKSLSAGEKCDFTSPHGAVKGTCWAPERKPLACKPKEAPNEGLQPNKQ
ncbi:MAG: hypothetical protein KDI45_10675 [Candidatus Accumulibacter sp.]|nr:hypothetical protein [Accumulibacter sp.]